MPRENSFQSHLIKRLKTEFPGCFVTKLDTGYIQGSPDLLILFGRRWAVLEVKKSKDAPRQPNQEHYIEVLDSMWFAALIYPENEEEIFRELQFALQLGRASRFLKSE